MASQEHSIESAQPFVSLSPPPRRHSYVRFSNGTKDHSQSPMSSFRRTQSESDESTPIRAAKDQTERRYGSAQANGSPTTVTNSTATSSSEPPSSSTLVNHGPGEDGNSREEDEDNTKEPKAWDWLTRMTEKYGSVTLENKGAVARDHLALERTFLAWLRTSLAFASIGIAVTQLFRLNTTIQSRNESMLSLARTMPLSPLLGQSVPPEMIPLLQQLAASLSSAQSPPTLGPTLLDQILLLPPTGISQHQVEGFASSADGVTSGAAARMRHIGKPLGATFIAISIVILCIGFHRYFEGQHWIIRGKFPASRGSIFAVAFITGSLIIASLVVVLAVAGAPLQAK